MSVPIRLVVPGCAPVDVLAEPDAPHARAARIAAAGHAVGLDALTDDTPEHEPAPPLLAGTTLRIGSAARATAAWELVVLDGPDRGRYWPLPEGTAIVGRGAHAAIGLADEHVSRRHCTIDVTTESCRIVDLDSTSGTLVDGADADAGVVVAHPGAEVRFGATRARIVALDAQRAAGPDGRIAHNRPPRTPPFSPPALRVPAPPLKPARARLTLIGAILPLGGGLALWALMGSPIGLVMAAFSPLALVGQWLFDRRHGNRQWRTVRAEYREQLGHLAATAHATAVRWRASAAAQFPDPVATAMRARHRDAACWDRRPGDADFATVRIAADDRMAAISIDLEPGGAPELRAEAQRLIAEAAPVRDIPVTIDSTNGPVGVSGPLRYDTLAWILSALATTHSPRDLRVALCAGDDPDDVWRFAAWLPHTEPLAEISAPSLCARSAERTAELLVALDAEVRRRSTAPHGTHPGPTILVVVPDADRCDRVVVGRIAELGASVGVHLLVGALQPAQLPGACATVMSCGEQHSMLRTPDGTTRTALHYDSLPAAAHDEIARALAGLRDASASPDAHHLPTRVRLGECVGGTDESAIASRWAASRQGAPLAAAIGVGPDGPLTLDLRAHGPHALIAGTTGSGKSVLLQALVAAFAATHPPERLTFVLIDYKGGAAFGPCVGLPHVAGLVTDLDDGAAHRVLVALEAELRRREAVIRDAGVADLAAMEAAHAPDTPPNLCVVIDEFAALVREVPAFIDGMVDLAQRGRSLGMHLVLATQKPAGVINDRMRANTALRIALRTTDATDSTDVLGTDAAAHIDREAPGRGIVSFGPGQRVPFQSAFVGAAAPTTGARPALLPFDTGTEPPGAPTAAPPPSDDTDLTRLLVAVDAASRALDTDAARCPWLEPLPSSLPLSALSPASDAAPLRLAIGRRDEPAHQRQPVHELALADAGAVLITGAAATGTSTTLTTIAVAAAQRHTPDALQIHILEDGSGALGALAPLPHVTAMVGVHDTDATTHYLEFLDRELDTRRALLRDRDVAEWGALGANAPPRLLVLLDGLGTFLHGYERLDAGRWHELFLRIVGDSRACGVHWCLTAERRTGLPPALLAHATERIALGDDPDDYPARHSDARTIRRGPGRAAIHGAEVQIAHAGATPDAAATARACGALAAQCAPPDRAVCPFPLPAVVAAPSGARRLPLEVMLGVSDHGDPVTVDLEHESLLVCGPRGSGRTNTLALIAAQLAATANVVTVRTRDRDTDPVAALRALLVDLGSDAASGPVGTTVVLVDDADLLVDGDAAAALDGLAKLAGRRPVRIVAACDMFTVTRSFAPWVAELKRSRRAVLLQPSIANDGDAFGVRLRARPGSTFPPGRGYVVERGEATLLQCARP